MQQQLQTCLIIGGQNDRNWQKVACKNKKTNQKIDIKEWNKSKAYQLNLKDLMKD